MRSRWPNLDPDPTRRDQLRSGERGPDAMLPLRTLLHIPPGTQPITSPGGKLDDVHRAGVRVEGGLGDLAREQLLRFSALSVRISRTSTAMVCCSRCMLSSSAKE